MHDGANIGVIFGLVGGCLACVGVPLIFVYVFTQLRAGKKELAETEASVRAGTVAELLPWGPSSLAELTREWVGGSMYTRGIPGQTDQAAGRVPSSRSPTGWLAAFAMNAQNRGAMGQVVAITSAHRVQLDLGEGLARVTVNGAPFGMWRAQSGELTGADGTPAGTYRRDPGADVFFSVPGLPTMQVGGRDPLAHLAVRGRDVVTVDTRTTSDSKRARQLTPLFPQLAPSLSPEEEMWALVAALLELAWFGPRLAHAKMSGR